MQATLSDILRQLGMYGLSFFYYLDVDIFPFWLCASHIILVILGTHFGIDLMHRKAEVKDIITDVINSMSDDEEEGEGEDAEDNAEGGDDADKDGDEDDD